MKSRGRYQESRLRSGARWRGHINRPCNEAAFAWFGDPIVMRFTPTGPDASPQQTKARLGKYHEHQTAHGFSKWIILDRGSARPMGDAGLLVLKEYGWIDFGVRLAQSYWGKGLAT